MTNNDIKTTNVSITGATLNKSEVANPCGIIAYSYFNDFYSILYDNLTNISTITTEGINWASDIDRLSITDASKMWLNITDPRVINWMRISTIPTFRKLWARINHDIEPGQYRLNVTKSIGNVIKITI